MRVNYAIIFVSDMKRSIAFYRDVIGMPLKFETSHWTEFATDGATWALHQSETDHRPDPKGDPPPGRCRPVFTVPDLDAFHQRMIDHGVPCLQEPTELFGARLAQYRDPDGMPVSVSQARE